MSNKQRIVALTTIDNPYDPIENFDEWLTYDCVNGYGTCDLLGRMATTSYAFTDEENVDEIEHAIDEIVFRDPSNQYKKVVHEISED